MECFLSYKSCLGYNKHPSVRCTHVREGSKLQWATQCCCAHMWCVRQCSAPGSRAGSQADRHAEYTQAGLVILRHTCHVAAVEPVGPNNSCVAICFVAADDAAAAAFIRGRQAHARQTRKQLERQLKTTGQEQQAHKQRCLQVSHTQACASLARCPARGTRRYGLHKA